MNEYFHGLVETGEFEVLKAKWEQSDGEQCMDTYSFSGEAGTLRIATLGTWSPMSFYAGDELTGLFVELAYGFCEAYGYTPEIFRKGIEAVPPEQMRAARVLGFSGLRAFLRVVLPQALINLLPVYGGQFIAMVKLTSVAGYISVLDLTRASDIIRSRTYEAFFPLVTSALIYFLICAALVALLRVLERRIQPGSRDLRWLEELVDEQANREGRTGSRGTGQDRWRTNRHQGTGDTLLSIAHVRKSFGDVTPIRDLSCEVGDGEVVTVIGPSGGGKSTFLKLINRLEQPDAGQIVFEGKDTCARDYDLNALRRRIGMVFQSFDLFGHLTVVENVMLAQTELLHRTREEALAHSMALLSEVGLTDKALAYPCQLSGGQQQRVAIARAVAVGPTLLLLDEPTSALDPTTTGEVLSVIRTLARDGMTMIVVTHEMGFARDVSSRVLYLDDGTICEEGTPEQVLDALRTERAKRFVNHLEDL